MKKWIATLALGLSINSVSLAAPSCEQYVNVLPQNPATWIDPQLDEAAVLFYRAADHVDEAAPLQMIMVDFNQVFLGAVCPHQVMVVKIKPGEHTFVVGGKTQNAIDIDVRSGRVYPVELKPEGGEFAMVPHTMDRQIGQEIKSLKVVARSPKGVDKFELAMDDKVGEFLQGKTAQPKVVFPSQAPLEPAALKRMLQ